MGEQKKSLPKLKFYVPKQKCAYSIDNYVRVCQINYTHYMNNFVNFCRKLQQIIFMNISEFLQFTLAVIYLHYNYIIKLEQADNKPRHFVSITK
jgi:hypothetical protein